LTAPGLLEQFNFFFVERISSLEISSDTLLMKKLSFAPVIKKSNNKA